MNSRTRETLVALRALRLWAEYRFPGQTGQQWRESFDEALVELFHSESADTAEIIELALSENEQQAAEEIRRELGEELDGIATISNETNAKQLDAEEPSDADPRTGLTYGDPT